MVADRQRSLRRTQRTRSGGDRIYHHADDPETKRRFLAEAERLRMKVDAWLIEAGEMAIARSATR